MRFWPAAPTEKLLLSTSLIFTTEPTHGSPLSSLSAVENLPWEASLTTSVPQRKGDRDPSAPLFHFARELGYPKIHTSPLVCTGDSHSGVAGLCGPRERYCCLGIGPVWIMRLRTERESAMISSALKVAIGHKLARYFPKLWMERELRFRPQHFEREFWLVPIFCEKEKTAIDVGANEGTYSYFMARFSKNVVAFEPNTDLYSSLHRLLGRDFRIESVALSRMPSKATLRVDRSNTGVSTIEEKNDLSCSSDTQAIVSRPVETRTLDSFHFTNVSMIKIDVEGHEEAVIEGARDTIRLNRPVLIIESEDRHNFGAPRRLAEAFFELGYLVFYIKDRLLLDFNTLQEEDTAPANLIGGGSTYINNFIFIPAEQSEKIASVRARLLVN
jgi:FkbM family methyltransferase